MNPYNVMYIQPTTKNNRKEPRDKDPQRTQSGLGELCEIFAISAVKVFTLMQFKV